VRPLLAGRAQQVAGLVLLLFGLAVCWQAAQLSIGELSRPGPGFFPIVLAAILVPLAAWAMFEARLLGSETAPAAPAGPARFGQVALVAGLILAFAFLLEPLGYVVSMLILMLLLSRLAGRGWRFSVLLAAVATLLSYVLFDSLLGSPLPEGVLEGLP
jgi:putative tricarboxylic transport membrane protein